MKKEGERGGRGSKGGRSNEKESRVQLWTFFRGRDLPVYHYGQILHQLEINHRDKYGASNRSVYM